ncbi:MAG: acyl-CoA thioesterase [Crocinitomicaceae bacterium]|nr:acyl-CoA thioesterase [Crocinitomicaceae bacterium]
MIKPAEIQVRFSDLDVLGHVNNCVYLSYFETARVHYFGELLGYDWDWVKDGVLLVKNQVEYHKPVLLSHCPKITVSLTNMGRKSFQLTYALMVGKTLHASGSSTLVAFDSQIRETVSIPKRMREALESLRTE